MLFPQAIHNSLDQETKIKFSNVLGGNKGAKVLKREMTISNLEESTNLSLDIPINMPRKKDIQFSYI